MAVRLKVLFFASAREAAGTGQVFVELQDPALISSLLRKLMEDYPDLDIQGKQISVAVNKVYVTNEDIQLRDGDEVALLPPIAGG